MTAEPFGQTSARETEMDAGRSQFSLLKSGYVRLARQSQLSVSSQLQFGKLVVVCPPLHRRHDNDPANANHPASCGNSTRANVGKPAVGSYSNANRLTSMPRAGGVASPRRPFGRTTPTPCSKVSSKSVRPAIDHRNSVRRCMTRLTSYLNPSERC